jgi:hypothetical protein
LCVHIFCQLFFFFFFFYIVFHVVSVRILERLACDVDDAMTMKWLSDYVGMSSMRLHEAFAQSLVGGAAARRLGQQSRSRELLLTLAQHVPVLINSMVPCLLQSPLWTGGDDRSLFDEPMSRALLARYFDADNDAAQTAPLVAQLVRDVCARHRRSPADALHSSVLLRLWRALPSDQPWFLQHFCAPLLDCFAQRANQATAVWRHVFSSEQCFSAAIGSSCSSNVPRLLTSLLASPFAVQCAHVWLDAWQTSPPSPPLFASTLQSLLISICSTKRFESLREWRFTLPTSTLTHFFLLVNRISRFWIVESCEFG